jgi:hypothetical protein
MSKIAGWTKFDDYAWHSTKPVFGVGGTLYKFIWVTSNNTVRIVDAAPLVYNKMGNYKAVAYPISQSYGYEKYKTLKEAVSAANNLRRI